MSLQSSHRETVTFNFFRLPGVRYCRCFGIIDYIYAGWWKCRACGAWGRHW